MRKSIFARLASSAVTAAICLASIPSIPNAFAADQQEMGTKDGYDYEMWNQNYTGNIQYSFGNSGTFSCSWSGIENCLFRSGRRLGSTKKFQSYGGIVLEYEVDYHPQGNSYMCVYGWTQDPLVEYYIVEGWGDWRPPGSAQSLGTVNANGGTYDIYKSTRYNQPSIEGNKTFEQYWSVRQTSLSRNNVQQNMKGTINVSDHFEAWEKAGLQMGNMYEVALNIEGYRSSGSATVKKNNLIMGEGTSGTDTPSVPDTPIEPDENGYYFLSEFEDGTDDWGGRGSASAKTSSSESYEGSNSLFVSGRTDNWNGASISLSSAFKAGEAYSFGAAVMQNSETSTDMKLTLQYTDASGTESYDEVALVSAPKGTWVDLSNINYTIPAGAKNLILYIEAPDSLTDFYVDQAFGAVKGTPSPVKGGTVTPPPSSSGKVLKGDVNRDGIINVFDLIPMRKAVLNVFSGAATPPAEADVNSDGGVTVADLILLQKFLLSAEKKFPEPVTTTTVSTTTKAETTTTTTSSKPQSGGNLNEKIKSDMPESVPNNMASKQAGKDYGTIEKKTYFSTSANREKKVNVMLPAGYNSSEKYPVLYLLHGIMGNEDSMIGSDMGAQALLGNLTASGEAEKMIIVCPDMFTSKTMSGPSGIDVATCAAYDNFLYDIADDLMPFIEKTYSVKTGRDNTAITGFSMGGREAIYIGLMRPDLFGYVGGACPAPGITPAQDMFMTHPGIMQESELKFRDVGPEPYMFMISAAKNDMVVGTFPEQYHNAFTRNGVDHAWQVVNAGDHGGSTVQPHLYTFLRYVFK